MRKAVRIDAASYYNTLPGLAHECGDIWRDLPSFGLLGDSQCAGIVITPACDLSWQKSDTLTYLPIIPIRAFFGTDAALPVVLDRVVANLTSAGYSPLPTWASESYVAPDDTELASIEAGLAAYRASRQHSARILASLDKSASGIEIIKNIKGEGISPVPALALQELFGAEWQKIKSKIITNSYSPALHFLPNDQQSSVFSGVTDHSVVLFRYPMTVPVRMLNHAQETLDSDWSEKVSTMPLSNSLKEAFRGAKPIKLLSLKSAFLSDLLTRFSSLYNRIGSPDFSDDTVKLYSSEVDT